MTLEFNNALIVVAKRPTPGRTKTRLSPPLSPEQASRLYECFLSDTIGLMRQVQGVQKIIAYFDEADFFRRLAPDFELIQQEGMDLGARLDNATTAYLSRGYKFVVIMDSDSPTLPLRYLSQSFDVLADGADVVLGPCEDGGYYLIGLKKPAPRLLRDVQMSTPRVAADTIALAREEGLALVTLPIWYDVDDGSSLLRLADELENTDNHSAIATRLFFSQKPILRLIGKGD